MTEDEARDQVSRRFGVEAFEKMDAFLAMVTAENARQNLIGPATVDAIWSRHALDSLQLLAFVPASARRWIDIGTGGGFPGLAAAIAWPGEVMLVEPRKRRAAFLQAAIDSLALGDRVSVHACKVETIAAQADIISARAVATIQNLLRAAAHCATKGTRWLLPRGLLGEGELAALNKNWRLMFHVEQSLTNPSSSIVILDSVAPR